MPDSVPVCFVESSPSPQVGGVAPAYVPQSTTVTLSFADIGFAPSESTGAVRVSVNVPDSEPVFLMSTVPLEAGSAGRMLDAVRTAAPSWSLRIESVPDENVFEGFADEAVKFAPEP